MDETIGCRGPASTRGCAPIRERDRGGAGLRPPGGRGQPPSSGRAPRRRRGLPSRPARGRGASTSTGSTRAVRPPRHRRRARALVRAAANALPAGIRLALDGRAPRRPRGARCRVRRGAREAGGQANSEAYALSAGWPPRCAYSTFDPAVDLAARHEVDQAGHRLPLVDRVRDHALETARRAASPRASPRPGCRRCPRGSGRRAAPRPARRSRSRPMAAAVRARSARPAHGSRTAWRSRRCRRSGAAAARVLEHGEASDHARLGGARDRADHDRVEEDAKLALLLGDLERPAREPVPAERMVRGAGRDRVGLTAARLDVGDRLLPALA